MNNKADLSSLFSATFDTIQRNMQLVLVFLAVMIPVRTLALMFEGGGEDQLFGFSRGLSIDEALMAQGAFAVVAVVGAFVVGMVAYYWLIAGMTRQSVSPGFDRFWPFVGIYILSLIGMGLGMILLIVPGLILATRWLVVLPLTIERQDGAMDSFGDSFEMTRESAWSIFGTGAIMFIGLSIASAAVVGSTAVVSGDVGIITNALASLIEQISTVVFGAFSVGAYQLLRNNTEEVSEVFE